MSVGSSVSFVQRFRSLFATSTAKKNVNIDKLTLQSEKLLWITPFHHYRLPTHIHNSVNLEICELTKTEYLKFINSNHCKSNDDASIINNGFFKYQGAYLKSKTHVLDESKFILNGGWNALEQSESFKTLKQYIYECVLSYFKQCIKSDKELEILSSKHLNAYSWMSVHLNESNHPSHTHADSVVSGVYYIRVPSNNAHKIAFQDPKGIDLYNPESTFDLRPPPFDNEWLFTPTEGDIILFPSWLPHRVLPSGTPQSSDHVDTDNISRLSLAFNVLGSWKHNAFKHI